MKLGKIMKTLEIPDYLWEDFLKFLDAAQSNFTEQDVKNFTKNELKSLKMVEGWLEKYLKGGPSKRFETIAEKQKASCELGLIISGRLNEYAILKLETFERIKRKNW